MDVNELRQMAAKLLDEAEAIRTVAGGESRALSADEVEQCEQKMNEAERLSKQGETVERLARQRAAMAEGLVPAGQSGGAGGGESADDFSVAKLLRGVVRNNWRGADRERDYVASQNESDDADGGYLVPEETSKEIIELLRPQIAVQAAGARIVGMNRNSQVVNKITDGANVYYVDEEEEGTESALAFGQVRLNARKAIVLVPISNELLADADAAVEAIIRDDISKSLALSIDQKCMFGGGGKEPLGLINISGVSAAASAVALGSLAFSHTKGVKKKVRLANGEFTGWAMHPEIWETLNDKVDGEGRPLLNGGFAQANSQTLHGFGVKETSQAKILTKGYIFGGNWGDMVIGIRKRLEFAVSPHVDFQKDRTWIRAICRWDMVLRHNASISYQEVTGLTA